MTRSFVAAAAALAAITASAIVPAAAQSSTIQATTVVCTSVEASAAQNVHIFSLFGCTIFMQLDLTTSALTMTTFLTPGLTATSRQIVFGGLVGQVGADVLTINTDAALNGTINLSASRVAAVMAGQAYVNFGTAQYPNGETRGQICFGTCGLAVMTTVQANGAVDALGGGYAIGQVVVVNETAGDVNITVKTFNTVSVTASHIHMSSSPGEASGNIACTISASTLTANVTSLPCTISSLYGGVNALRGFLGYFNLHTAVVTGGQLRGAIIFPSTLNFTYPYQAVLNGASQIPARPTPAMGIALFVQPYLQLGLPNVWVSFMSAVGLNTSQTMAHIHGPVNSQTTESAGIMQLLPIAPHAWNFIAAPSTLTGNITAGRTYINVHTTWWPAGEIRGALVAAVTATPRPSAATAPAVGLTTAAALVVATLAALAVRRD